MMKATPKRRIAMCTQNNENQAIYVKMEHALREAFQEGDDSKLCIGGTFEFENKYIYISAKYWNWPDKMEITYYFPDLEQFYEYPRIVVKNTFPNGSAETYGRLITILNNQFPELVSIRAMHYYWDDEKLTNEDKERLINKSH